MPKYSFAKLMKDEIPLQKAYYQAKEQYLDSDIDLTDLDLIFKIACEHITLFPDSNLKSDQPTITSYFEKWVKGYYDAIKNPPSVKIAKPKSSCSDPAVRTIVEVTQNISKDAAVKGELNHNLFMSAENKQGNLLEEYIATVTRPYGFLWCDGNVLKAIDFCNTDGTFFLQIKNKNNTENSSSSKIREQSPVVIEKWNRLKSQKKDGKIIPQYNWDKLNNIVNEHKTEGFNLPKFNVNEENYQEFLRTKAKSNPKLITSD